ncbi:hypothetical protein DB42_BK00100 [Neochlamydia sp. EPS4]|nr:hypothetical protein DB42_BK00100 [Neochlamydia sp. EPS4]
MIEREVSGFLASPHDALKHFIKKKPDKTDRLIFNCMAQLLCLNVRQNLLCIVLSLSRMLD